MTTLFTVWIVSLLVLIALILKGGAKAKLTPASYEFNWHPLHFVTVTVFPFARGLWVNAKFLIMRGGHKLFHMFFHRMKRFHDRIYGKNLGASPGTPSFFLKTIAEHKEENQSQSGMS